MIYAMIYALGEWAVKRTDEKDGAKMGALRVDM